MLAQLDRLTGVDESRVDWEGKCILIRLSPGAQAKDVAARAAAILGPGTARFDAATEAERIASFRQGESWMRSGETIRLSRYEAGVLGKRFARDVAGPAGWTGEMTKRLETILTEEIGDLFERMHASGTVPGAVPAAQLKEVAARIRGRCWDFLTEAQAEAVFKVIKASVGGCEPEE